MFCVLFLRRRNDMPRSFLVKNKRCASYNIHRSYEEEQPAEFEDQGETLSVTLNGKCITFSSLNKRYFS